MRNAEQQNLLTAARTFVAVQPLHMGRRPPTAQSGRYGTVLRQPRRTGSERGNLGLARHPSSRWLAHPGGLQDAVGRCRARPALPRHRFRRAPTRRRHGKHDQFLQEPGDDRRVSLRDKFWRRRHQLRRRDGGLIIKTQTTEFISDRQPRRRDHSLWNSLSVALIKSLSGCSAQYWPSFLALTTRAAVWTPGGC